MTGRNTGAGVDETRMAPTIEDPLVSLPLGSCLLSNGHYSVLLTAAGSGYSVVDGIDLTRWREDATCDCWGQYCYVRDLDTGRVWSAGRQPLGRSADDYTADLRPDRATFRRRDGEIETRYEVVVVPDANAEVRRITLTNHGDRPRTLEVTSYAEVALNPRRADQAHPAFAKLFLETEYEQATYGLAMPPPAPLPRPAAGLGPALPGRPQGSLRHCAWRRPVRD